jgi:predicted DNA-binding protein with PD1-like motif
MYFRIIFSIILMASVQMSMAQSNLSSTKCFAFRILPGQDLKSELDKKVKENGWKAAGIVTAVGSLNSAKIRFANQPDATEIPGKLEILSLSGTLGPDGNHLHLSVADSTGKTYGGHLMAGCPVYTTAEIILVILENYVFKRETDPTYGYKELVVEGSESGKK